MRHINKLSTVITTILFIFLCVFVYWLFEPPIISVSNVKTTKLSYHPGDTITYTVDYCKRKDGVAMIYRSLADTYIIPYAPLVASVPLGCNTVTRNDLKIPDFVKPDGDSYHLEADIHYQLNPIRDEDTHWRSNEFIVE